MRYYGHRQLRQQQAIAEELFYAMKSLDVDMANVEATGGDLGQRTGQGAGASSIRNAGGRWNAATISSSPGSTSTTGS